MKELQKKIDNYNKMMEERGLEDKELQKKLNVANENIPNFEEST